MMAHWSAAQLQLSICQEDVIWEKHKHVQANMYLHVYWQDMEQMLFIHDLQWLQQWNELYFIN